MSVVRFSQSLSFETLEILRRSINSPSSPLSNYFVTIQQHPTESALTSSPDQAFSHSDDTASLL